MDDKTNTDVVEAFLEQVEYASTYGSNNEPSVYYQLGYLSGFLRGLVDIPDVKHRLEERVAGFNSKS